MSDFSSIPTFVSNQKSSIALIGIITVMTVGAVACIALVLLLLWLVVTLLFVAVSSIVATLSALGALYSASHPLIQLVLIATLGYGLYLLSRKLLVSRKGAHAWTY